MNLQRSQAKTENCSLNQQSWPKHAPRLSEQGDNEKKIKKGIFCRRKAYFARHWVLRSRILEEVFRSRLENNASQVLRKLSDEEWARLIKELGRYALTISRRLRWRTENPYELPGGETVDSIVSKAIKRVLIGALEGSGIDGPKPGVRRWDPKKSPDLKKYLMNVIKSLLNHLATSEENTKFRRVPDDASEDGAPWEMGSGNHSSDTEWLGRQASNPEDILLEKETRAINDRALEMLVEGSRSDSSLAMVISAMRRGHRAPRDISSDTGLSVSEVYSAIKRLDRKAAIVRRELSRDTFMNNASI